MVFRTKEDVFVTMMEKVGKKCVRVSFAFPKYVVNKDSFRY
jgi:hypothetical protein